MKKASDATSTARIPVADLETILRRESGTRPAITRDEIARHVAADRFADDPHSRPTIEVFPPISFPARTSETPGARTGTPEPPVVVAQPRWLVPAVLASVLVLVLAMLTIGFFIARITGHH
jgi:hypothetical protein